MLLVWSSRDTRKRRGLLWKTSVWIHTKMADACQTHSPFSLSVTQINVLKTGGFVFWLALRAQWRQTCSTVGRIKGIWFGIFWKEIAATHAVFGQSAELKRPPLWQTKWPVVKKKQQKTNKQTKPRCCHSEARSAYPWCRWDKDSRLSKSFQ